MNDHPCIQCNVGIDRISSFTEVQSKFTSTLTVGNPCNARGLLLHNSGFVSYRFLPRNYTCITDVLDASYYLENT